jgi:hypothetical protein
MQTSSSPIVENRTVPAATNDILLTEAGLEYQNASVKQF